jgi:hypothetical protein
MIVQDCGEADVMIAFALLLGPSWVTPHGDDGGGGAAVAVAVAEYSYRLTAPGRVATCTTRVERVHVQPFPGHLGPA